VLLVDDHAMMRAGLKALLEAAGISVEIGKALFLSRKSVEPRKSD